MQKTILNILKFYYWISVNYTNKILKLEINVNVLFKFALIHHHLNVFYGWTLQGTNVKK